MFVVRNQHSLSITTVIKGKLDFQWTYFKTTNSLFIYFFNSFHMNNSLDVSPKQCNSMVQLTEVWDFTALFTSAVNIEE